MINIAGKFEKVSIDQYLKDNDVNIKNTTGSDDKYNCDCSPDTKGR